MRRNKAISRRLPRLRRPSSWRFIRFRLHAFVYRNPVYLPRFAPVIRERLFKTTRVRFDIRDDKADDDGSAIKWFLIKKLAATIFEFADRLLAHGATAAARKIEAPLVRLRIVEPQVQTFDVPCRAIDLEFYQVRAPIPDLPNDGGSFIFDPSIGAAQGLLKAPEVRSPGTELKVKIVSAISVREV